MTGEPREWNELENLWHDVPVQETVPAALRARVRNDARRQRALVLIEAAHVVVLLGWGAFELLEARGARDWLIGSVILGLTLIAAFASIHLRRGLWVSPGESVRACLDLSLRRIAAGKRTLRAYWSLFTFECALFVGAELASRAGLLPFAWLGDMTLLLQWFGAFALALGAWSVWYYRWLRRRERALRGIERAWHITDLDEV